jgi:ATP-dependent protease ClpP protease subunit
VFDGFAIYNVLKRHPAKVTATIEGVAASMASVIAMAADRIRMPTNALLMIHDPVGVVGGGAEQIESFAKALDRMRNSIADAYATRAKKSREMMLGLMARETWLSADEAVELGLADEAVGEVKIAAHVDLGKFKHPPPVRSDGSYSREIWDNWNRRRR